MDFYDFKTITATKEEFDFAQLKGKTVLIVNTASKCGFTGQYAGLEKLYKEYKDRGLVVLGFPCDQFAHQEPGTDEQISQFCSLNYGVTFPIMSKINVNGDDAHPLYVWLKERANGLFGSSIKWNFTKFLISGDGKRVKRFGPKVEPSSLRKEIGKLL
ncbi:MAG: glutathione peroxidase [Sphaerochaetaceae bacterium]|nr:glutathione peroxidase [Sphaerochaetaceae bacterium]